MKKQVRAGPRPTDCSVHCSVCALSKKVSVISRAVVEMTRDLEAKSAVAISRYSSLRRGLNFIVVERELLRARESDWDSFFLRGFENYELWQECCTNYWGRRNHG
jgi:hypothetical protein